MGDKFNSLRVFKNFFWGSVVLLGEFVGTTGVLAAWGLPTIKLERAIFELLISFLSSSVSLWGGQHSKIGSSEETISEGSIEELLIGLDKFLSISGEMLRFDVLVKSFSWNVFFKSWYFFSWQGYRTELLDDKSLNIFSRDGWAMEDICDIVHLIDESMFSLLGCKYSLLMSLNLGENFFRFEDKEQTGFFIKLWLSSTSSSLFTIFVLLFNITPLSDEKSPESSDGNSPKLFRL